MVDVLYDYQIAMALAAEDAKSGELAEVEYRYTQAVFKKHDITDEEFKLSVAHFARNPKELLAITDKVNERITGESAKTEVDKSQSSSLSRDTLVLWENRRGVVLTSSSNNRYECNIPASALKPCDRLIFGFTTKWFYREGTKFGTVSLTATFDNDSTAVVNESLREFATSQAVSINVPQGRSLRKVKAVIYQSAIWQKTPQVLALSDLALWGIKTTNDVPKEPARPSVSTDDKQSPASSDSTNAKQDTAKPSSTAH